MFTGIIETIARVQKIEQENDNLHLTIASNLAKELKIDQSVAHNGVCLTVVAKDDEKYTVTAIKETLEKTTVGTWQLNDNINIERAMKIGDRLDGHIVQGHIDETGVCVEKKETNGSWLFTFAYHGLQQNITIEKGSITVNGVSLTVINSEKNQFSVAIIPYTYLHTNFQNIEIGTKVNLEFDVIGKYVKRLAELR